MRYNPGFLRLNLFGATLILFALPNISFAKIVVTTIVDKIAISDSVPINVDFFPALSNNQIAKIIINKNTALLLDVQKGDLLNISARFKLSESGDVVIERWEANSKLEEASLSIQTVVGAKIKGAPAILETGEGQVFLQGEYRLLVQTDNGFGNTITLEDDGFKASITGSNLLSNMPYLVIKGSFSRNASSSLPRVKHEPRAITKEQRALERAKKAQEREIRRIKQDISSTILDAWVFLQDKSDHSSALNKANTALEMITKLYPDDKRLLFSVYHVKFRIYESLNDFRNASTFFNMALATGSDGSMSGHSELQSLREDMVDFYVSKKGHKEARRLAEENLDVLGDTYTPSYRVEALKRLSDICLKEKSVDLAIYYGILAVNAIQTQRSSIKTLDKDSQAGLIELHSDFYKQLAGLLLDAGRNAEAQQVFSKINEEDYFTFLSIPPKNVERSAMFELTPLEQAFQTRKSEIKARTVQLGNQLAELEKDAAMAPLTPEQNLHRNKLLVELESANAAYAIAMADLERLVDRQYPERQKEIQALNLRLIQPLQSTLKRVGEGTVLIHWVMLDDQTKIILTTANVPPIVYTSKVRYRDLKAKIASLRSMLKSPSSKSDLDKQSRELYQILLGPVENDLRQIKAKTLMLAMHGELRYLPFAALHDGKGYLVESYNLAHYNEAVRDRLRDQPSITGSYAAFGLTNAVVGLAALPGVKHELDGLSKDGWLKGETRLNAQFDKSSLLAALDRKPSILHIASHFAFRPGKADNSYLVLGTGEKLPISDMHALRFDGVDLVTLSACETAIGGGRDELGQEVTGLASVVQDNGAQAVMATLWKVSDGSTAQLVREFYRNRQKGKNKAEALRLAQINVMRGRLIQDKPMERGAVPVDPLPTLEDSKSTSSGWSHPYYWAPFILMGNWL